MNELLSLGVTLLAFAALLYPQGSLALECYDGNQTQAKLVDCPRCSFCSVAGKGPGYQNIVRRFGQEELFADDDILELFAKLKRDTSIRNKYKLMTVCKLEFMNFDFLPNYAYPPEMTYMCHCIEDGCNSGKTMTEFLDAMSKRQIGNFK